MEKLVINGPSRLQGDVTISGAKNAAVAIIPATLLIDGVCTLENVPNISDVKISCSWRSWVLKLLGFLNIQLRLILDILKVLLLLWI